MTSQQKANETLVLWQSLRDLKPHERLQRLDEYEATLRAVQEVMKERSDG